MVTTPCALMRWSCHRSRRSLTADGSDDARMSKRSCAAFDTLLTFCPPAPCARTAVHSISAAAMRVTLRPMISAMRGGSLEPYRGKPGLLRPRQSWRTVVVAEFDEARSGDIAPPCVEAQIRAQSPARPAFGILAVRIGAEQHAAAPERRVQLLQHARKLLHGDVKQRC